MATSVFITVFVIVWSLQILFGYLQIRTFNHSYAALAQKGNFLGIGKSLGRFKPKVVIILALDEKKNVQDSLIIQGLTVFSRPQAIPALHGMFYQDIRPEVIFPAHQRCREALTAALTVRD